MDEGLTYNHLIAEASPGVLLARLNGVLRGATRRHVSLTLLAAVRKMHARMVLLDVTAPISWPTRRSTRW